MTTDLLSDLDVFYGDLTTSRAYVYARLPRPADVAGLSLTGQVRGPRCKLAQTLPVTSPLIDLGPGPTLLARALVPDPVFWSPDLPAIYDVTVNLFRGTEVVATAHRQIGLRSLGVRGRDLVLNGKRWVLRGVSTYATTASMPREWHDVQAAYVSDDAKLSDLAEASECGTLAIIHAVESDDLIPRIRHLAQLPAVAIVATEATLPLEFRKSLVAPNLLFAQWLSDEHWGPHAPWADLLLVCADEPELLVEAGAMGEVPIVAARHLEPPGADLASARAACDALQRDLAPLGQFAGYVV
jgi:hypothetical protein